MNYCLLIIICEKDIEFFFNSKYEIKFCLSIIPSRKQKSGNGNIMLHFPEHSTEEDNLHEIVIKITQVIDRYSMPIISVTCFLGAVYTGLTLFLLC